jgi:hypothetical protein
MLYEKIRLWMGHVIGIDIGNELVKIAPILAGKTEIPNDRFKNLVHQMTWNITRTHYHLIQ